MPAFLTLIWLFLAILALGVGRAIWRRRWLSLLHAVVFAGPAAAAWPWWLWYESAMPPGANIRIDLPLIWILMFAVSVSAVLYLLVILVEALSLGAVEAAGFFRRKTRDEGRLRSWQDPTNPRGAGKP